MSKKVSSLEDHLNHIRKLLISDLKEIFGEVDYKNKLDFIDSIDRTFKNIGNNILYIAFGEEKSLSDWSKDKRCQVTRKTLANRLRMLKWDTEASIKTPVIKGRPKKLKF